jgi:hypothetical protein
MNPKEFRQRLETLAVLKDRKPTKSANHRPAIEYITEIDEDGEEYQVPVEITHNPTLGFELIKVHDQHKICELGCGEVVTNQIVEKRYGQTPKPHWKTRCKNCDCYVSPDGEGFIKGSHAVQNAYARYFNGQKCIEKISNPEENANNIPRIIEHEDYTETITNDNIIRRYK